MLGILRASSIACAVLVATGCTQKTSPPARDGKPDEPKEERVEPPPPIDLSGYDRSCSADADCTVVHPQPCAKCGCTDDPIATKELTRFREAIGAVKCPDKDPWPDIDCGACMDYVAYCDAGQCKSKPAD